MKLIRVLSLVALLGISVSVALADSGGDGQPKLGGAGPGSPDCSSFQATADQNGAINTDCTVTGSTATTIFFAAPNSETSANPNDLGLTCLAPNFLLLGWTQNANVQVTINGVLTDECSFTAPAVASAKDIADALMLDATQSTGSAQCGWREFITGIPVGCDITISTTGNKPNQLFAPDASFDVSPSQPDIIPFPEPATLWLMVLGLAGLAITQRRLVRKSNA